MKALLKKLKKAIMLNSMLLVIVFSGIAVLAVSICSLVMIIYLIDTSQQNIRGKLLESAKRLATLTTVEELDSYREPADAQRPEWKALRQKLIGFGKDADIFYAYYMRVEGDKVQYIVDNDENEKTRVGIDTEPEDLDGFIDMLPAIEGKARVTKLGEYAKNWPGLASAYAPMLDSDGRVVAICGVDIKDKELLKMHRIEIWLAVLELIAIAAVFVVAGFGFGYMQQAVRAKTREVVTLQNAIMHGVANMVESRDSSTGGHIERTQHYLRVLISGLDKIGLYRKEMKNWDIELMIDSSQLHDVGKIAISDSILKKPGRLTKEEFDTMKKHVEFGASIIERIESEISGTNFLRYAKILAESHHEKWDGSGYPKGLSGSDIPLPGRLMAIADTYDALTSNRPYKEAFPPDEAARIIREGRGSHFDPVLVDAFELVADQFASIARQPKNQYIA